MTMKQQPFQDSTPFSGKPKALTPSIRRAVVLLAVLMVITLLALAGYRYADLSVSESKATETALRTQQALALVHSGVNYAAALLSKPDYVQSLLGGNPFNNPARFTDQLALANRPGRFLIFTPLESSQNGGEGGIRYGVSDENGLINLNAWMKRDKKGDKLFEMLKKLPNMTDEIAAAIVDWLDEDQTPRQGGAEDETYGAMNPPYRAKNGPLDSLEELLLVKGVTPELLFGSDYNRNGIQDPGEPSANGRFDRGWSAYLTIYSREQNLDSTDQPRIYLNDPDIETLYSKLSSAVGTDMATYVALARTYGTSKVGSDKKSNSRGFGLSRSVGGRSGLSGLLKQGGGQGGGTSGGGGGNKKINSIYDLIGTQVSIPSQDGKSPPTIYPSPLNDQSGLQQYLPLMLDKTTSTKDMELPARININTAPEAVIAALPELTTEEIQFIISSRPRLDGATGIGENYLTPAWLITEAGLKPETVKKLASYITTRSQVYRFQVVGYFEQGGPTARAEAVVDTNAGRPRILYFRDLSILGPGINLNTKE